MTEFRKGDIVALVTTEVETVDAFGVKLVDGFWFHPDRLTLVERTVREVTVTLTEDQLRAAETRLGDLVANSDAEFEAFQAFQSALKGIGDD